MFCSWLLGFSYINSELDISSTELDISLTELDISLTLFLSFSYGRQFKITEDLEGEKTQCNEKCCKITFWSSMCSLPVLSSSSAHQSITTALHCSSSSFHCSSRALHLFLSLSSLYRAGCSRQHIVMLRISRRFHFLSNQEESLIGPKHLGKTLLR